MNRNDRRAAVRVLATCAVAALALSGCGSARAGAAAVVGANRISTERLATSVDSALADPAASSLASDRPSFQRDVLSRLITADVIGVAAARNGVSVTQGQVDAEYASLESSVGGPEELRTQAAAAGLDLAGVRTLARTRALSAALGDRLTADVPVPPEALQQAYQAGSDTYDRVRVAQIQVATPAEAQALLLQARPLSDEAFGALARARSLDAASKAAGGDLGLAPRSAFVDKGLQDYATAAFAAKVGDTFAVAGYVVRVLERRTTSLAEATPELRRTALQQQRDSAVQKLLISTASSLHVQVNPRFGSWDGEQLSVVPATPTGDREVSSPQAPPGGPAAGDPGSVPEGSIPEGAVPDDPGSQGAVPNGAVPDGATDGGAGTPSPRP